MNKLLVALYDTQGYMRALADYFGRKNFLLDSRLFTKLESLNEFLKDSSRMFCFWERMSSGPV